VSAGEQWAGCHGVRTRGEPFDIGTASGSPIADALVRVGDVPPPQGPELWRLHAEVTTEGVKREVDRWLCEHAGGVLGVHASAGPALTVDPASNEICIEEGEEHVVLQLLTSFALPLVLNTHGVLAVHASACARDGAALVVSGESGSGKSSTLVRMIDEGWQAVSEDVCAIDLRDGVPRVWPGPPWVRRVHGEGGPAGSVPRFETPDKTAWDIAPAQAGGPLPVAGVVFLEPPGGERPQWDPVPQAEVVRVLARHAAWLRDPAEAPRSLFPLAMRLAGAVRVARLRLPHTSGWLDDLPAVLASGF
jgi:hypothetical protein